jgi:hypothetical protein
VPPNCGNMTPVYNKYSPNAGGELKLTRD